MEEVIEAPKKKRKVRRPQPTGRQIKALQYMNQGMSKRQAMLKAGYAPTSADKPSQALMPLKGVQHLIGALQGALVDLGVTPEYQAEKIKEWMEAKKQISVRGTKADAGTDDFIEVPDYDIQLKAYDRWKHVFDDTQKKDDTKGLTRKLTIEEFIRDEK